MPAAVLPTPLPPVSFAQLNAARAHSTRVAHAAAHTAARKHAAQERRQVHAAQAPLPGVAGIAGRMAGYAGISPVPAPAKPTPAPSWLWIPAVLIAALLLRTFFSDTAQRKSQARREAGARFWRKHRPHPPCGGQCTEGALQAERPVIHPPRAGNAACGPGAGGGRTLMDKSSEVGEEDKPSLRDDERQRCEVWTRVMGYHRPTGEFNEGKKAEFAERVFFREAKAASVLPCAAAASGDGRLSPGFAR